MKFAISFIFFVSLVPISMAEEPAKPASAEVSDEMEKEVVMAALASGAEFNRLRESNPEWKKVATVEQALDRLSKTRNPTSKALVREDLVKHRKAVRALLVLQDGRLAGTPGLNQLVSGARGATVGAMARRNAQNIASVFNAARAAGSPDLKDVKTAAEAAECIRTGVKGGGEFSNVTFAVGLEPDALKQALTFLSFEEYNGQLVFDGSATLPNDADAGPAPDAVAQFAMHLKERARREAE